MAKALKFIWNALWRERDKFTRSVNMSLVTLPAVAALVFQGWSKEWWPWWAWMLIIIGSTGAAMIVALFSRVYELEQAREKKIALPFKDDDAHQFQILPSARGLNVSGRVCLENLSESEDLDGATVTLVSITGGGEKFNTEVLLQNFAARGPMIDVRPRRTTYFDLFTTDYRVVQEMRLALAPSNGGPRGGLDAGIFRLDVVASAAGVPPTEQSYYLKIEDTGDVEFRLWSDADQKAGASDYVPRQIPKP